MYKIKKRKNAYILTEKVKGTITEYGPFSQPCITYVDHFIGTVKIRTSLSFGEYNEEKKILIKRKKDIIKSLQDNKFPQIVIDSMQLVCEKFNKDNCNDLLKLLEFEIIPVE